MGSNGDGAGLPGYRFFRPAGADSFAVFVPRLTPLRLGSGQAWAAFFRPVGACASARVALRIAPLGVVESEERQGWRSSASRITS